MPRCLVGLRRITVRLACTKMWVIQRSFMINPITRPLRLEQSINLHSSAKNMKYHVPTDQFTVEQKDFKFAAMCMREALKGIRKLAGLTLDKYTRTGVLTEADHAQRAIIESAEVLGIDFGVRWGNELDLRDPE